MGVMRTRGPGRGRGLTPGPNDNEDETWDSRPRRGHATTTGPPQRGDWDARRTTRRLGMCHDDEEDQNGEYDHQQNVYSPRL